ncbi:hypothetical protein [Parapedobacter sp. 10938]|uniref:hypothetical protein n=1 Tax=Parapedobacter flavus TaxID=3110225 RepID=UPI002DBD7D28|nr:hypothetical protein [Parapedobacter sp. 10938]MEC3878282.1 hypothetical protein [Parapedobacter sp. 10938]
MAKGPVFVLFVACLSFHGCKKGGCNVVDYIPFQQTISLVAFNELHLLMQPVALGPEYGGVAGLIVMQVSEGEYVAFDRCSTVNPEKRCAVELEGEGPVAVDPCSGAKFILTNGSPSAIAECPLRPYYVRRNGEILTVSN